MQGARVESCASRVESKFACHPQTTKRRSKNSRKLFFSYKKSFFCSFFLCLLASLFLGKPLLCASSHRPAKKEKSRELKKCGLLWKMMRRRKRGEDAGSANSGPSRVCAFRIPCRNDVPTASASGKRLRKTCLICQRIW